MKTEKIVWGVGAAAVCAAILIVSPVSVRAQAAQPPARPPAGTSDSQAPITSDPVVGTSSTAPPASAAKPGAPAAPGAKTPAPAATPAPATAAAPAAAPPPSAPKPSAPTPVAPKPTAVATPTSGKGAVVEDIIAHVNNEVITLSDYQKAQQQRAKEVQDGCNCTGLQLQNAIEENQKNVLRDLIDQQLLIQRAKDMSVDVTADVVSRLNDFRKQNNLATLDDLQKAVESSGESWDDFKQQITNNALTQEVIRQEVGQRVDIGPEEVKAYYDAHKSEFDRPEEVQLSEIVLSTEGKTGDQIDAVKKRADDFRSRIQSGENFASLAKRYSEDPATAADGGALGMYTKGQLSAQIEDAVFKLDKGGLTDVIQTKTGFMILRVDEHYQAGEQPLEAVQDEIQNKIYQEKMDPQMRAYLAELREQSYVVVKPGYTDSAAITTGTAIQEVAPTPDAPDKKAKKKMSLPKVSG
jgi:peptidyl-prolyl cis-trans isomerase SurA